MPPLALPLRTERLTLRTFQETDEAWLHRLYSDPGVARYLLEEAWNTEQTQEKLSARLKRTGLDGEAGALALVIERDERPVGDIALWLTDRERRVAEIGWVQSPLHSGRGYAREAATAVLDLAFTHYGLHRVAAQMDARNQGSARLAAAIGMRQEAHLRQDWWCKGEWTDTLIFGALSTDR